MLFKISILASLAMAAVVTVYDDDSCENEDFTSPSVSIPPATTFATSVSVSLSTGLFTSVLASITSAAHVVSSPTTISTSSATAVSSAAGAVSTEPTSSLLGGLGTWYGETCGESGCWENGPCSFVDYVLPATIDGSTCVSEDIWNNGYQCGACVEIMYKGKKKIAMVTNKTGGNATHLDMTPDMFSQVADKSLGGINIQWDFVPCPITAPLKIKMHGGASRYWFAATVENAILRTAKMEVSTDSGRTWKNTTRNINNFFELSSTGGGTSTATAWIRVTSENGSQVVVESVNMASGAVTTATENYS